jgi:hypothetical protein
MNKAMNCGAAVAGALVLGGLGAVASAGGVGGLHLRWNGSERAGFTAQVAVGDCLVRGASGEGWPSRGCSRGDSPRGTLATGGQAADGRTVEV